MAVTQPDFQDFSQFRIGQVGPNREYPKPNIEFGKADKKWDEQQQLGNISNERNARMQLGGQDDDKRFLNRGGLDAISMPELLDLLDAKTVKDVRIATRGFVETIVETDRESFGADYKYDTQTYLKVLKGLEKKAKRENNKPLEAEYKRCGQEISTVSQLLYWMNTFNAVGKSMGELGSRFDTMSTGTLMYPEAFQIIFRLPSIEGNKSVGANIDKVYRACVVVGLCEDPIKLKQMRNKPGWKLLFGTPEEERKFLGNVDEWDEVRTIKTDPVTRKVVYDSLKREKESKIRDGIAKYGNLWARAETTEEAEEFRNSLLKLVDGDELALHLGMGIFKIWAGDAEHAAMVIEKDGKPTAQLEGWPNASDLAKLTHFNVWQMKQTAANHPCGPRETRGRVQKLLVSFPKFNVIEDSDGNKKTLYEEMWGYEGGEAKRLGDASWNRMLPDVWNDWGTRINIPAGGKDGTGLFGWLKSEKVAKPEELLADSYWEFVRLNLNVVVNEQLITDGHLSGINSKELGDRVTALRKEIADIYWKGIQSLPESKSWLNDEISLQVPLIGKTVTREQKWTYRDLIEHRMKGVGLRD